MRAKLKPLAQQVVVVTGAGSGLGLAVAHHAADAGAAVLLVGADEAAIRKTAESINAHGGRAHAVAADLALPEHARRVARAAIARFGGFDTWIDALGEEAGALKAIEEAMIETRAASRVGGYVHLARAALPSSARRSLGRARIAFSHIQLPAGALKDLEVAAAAALHAAASPIAHLVIGERGGLTFYSQARKHRGVVLGVGLVALGVAIWATRGATGPAMRPYVGRAVRPLILKAARRRPLTAAKLVVRHPRRALRLARALR